jgi:tryptophan synthase alpha chain
MGRIDELFKKKNKNVLNVYCTAGFPALDSTLEVIKALQENGADMIELGIPYSDPLADGEVIQASGNIALKNGMTVATLFEQLKGFRRMIHIPVLLMGYINPVLQYGFEKFCSDAASVGVDGLILPDLPIFEFANEYEMILKNYGLDFVFLVTPETSLDRIQKLDELSTGFLYAVSSSSTTGKDKNLAAQSRYFEKLKGMTLKNPLLVGFGIKDKASFTYASGFANGAIIGTAFIKALEKTNDIHQSTKDFLDGILR